MTNTKNISQDIQIKYIEEIIKIEELERKSLKFQDKIANKITAISGSMLYVTLHFIWFFLWIILNINLFGIKPFDPFPFSLLTMIVSLEAIFLSSFVLISENKQSLLADKRAKIDLVVNMIAESENTKSIRMLEEIQKKLGIYKKETQKIKELLKRTDIQKIAKEIERAERKKYR